MSEFDERPCAIELGSWNKNNPNAAQNNLPRIGITVSPYKDEKLLLAGPNRYLSDEEIIANDN